MISIEDALMYLNIETATDYERLQLELIINSVTAAIISYCGQDPREDLEQDCSVLSLVAARMLMQLQPQIVNSTTGIAEQSFNNVSVKFEKTTGLDAMACQLLSRFRKITIL